MVEKSTIKKIVGILLGLFVLDYFVTIPLISDILAITYVVQIVTVIAAYFLLFNSK